MTGRPAEAAAWYERALRLQGAGALENAQLGFQLGILYAEALRQPEQAAAAWRAVHRSHPLAGQAVTFEVHVIGVL